MMIDPTTVETFLGLPRIGVVGASDDPKNFGRTICHELRAHGRDVTAVHPTATTVDGGPCYPDLASVPGGVDGVIVMVAGAQAIQVVRQCIAQKIGWVWLFQGVGGAGAVTNEALELCAEHGISVVPGACPLMFLEPVAWFHRLHRGVRHFNGSLARAS